jgi:hypothetical protein
MTALAFAGVGATLLLPLLVLLLCIFIYLGSQE